MIQIVGSCCVVKIKSDIFVSFGMFSKVTFLLIITILGVSILQDWKVFYQRNLRVTSVTVIS